PLETAGQYSREFCNDRRRRAKSKHFVGVKIEERSGHAAEVERRHEYVRVECRSHDGDGLFFVPRSPARTSLIMRTTSASVRPRSSERFRYLAIVSWRLSFSYRRRASRTSSLIVRFSALA